MATPQRSAHGLASPNPQGTPPPPPSTQTAAAAAAPESVHVAIRVRPPKADEVETIVAMRPSRGVVIIDGNPAAFTCDSAMWSGTTPDLDGRPPMTQADVYATVGDPLLSHALSGLNACMLAYGQTGSGKTHTMMGATEDPADPERGIIPRLAENLFVRLAVLEEMQQGSDTKSHWKVHATYVEIYNEHLTDLLTNTAVTIREGRDKNFVLTDEKKEIVNSVHDVLSIIARGNKNRTTAATKMNDRSSRSHAVFILNLTETVEVRMENGKQEHAPGRSAAVKLVDLAGSERLNDTGATGDRLKEAVSINKSLSCLGLVIDFLTKASLVGKLPPYRDSALTKLIKDSLGGNSKTTMIATIGPSAQYREQTINTLNYASKARKIVNTPTVNEDPRATELRRAKEEALELRRQLEAAESTKSAAVGNLQIKMRELEERHEAEQMQRQAEAEKLRQREAELDRIAVRNAALEREMEEAEARLRAEMVARQAELESRRAEMEAKLQHMDREMRAKELDLVEKLADAEREMEERNAKLRADAIAKDSELQAKEAEQKRLSEQAAAAAAAKEAELAMKEAEQRKQAEAARVAAAAKEAELQAKEAEQKRLSEQAAAAAAAKEAALAKKEAEQQRVAAEHEMQYRAAVAAAEAERARREKEVEDLVHQVEASTARSLAQLKLKEAKILEESSRMQLEYEQHQKQLREREAAFETQRQAQEAAFAAAAARARQQEAALMDLKKREADKLLELERLQAAAAQHEARLDAVTRKAEALDVRVASAKDNAADIVAELLDENRRLKADLELGRRGLCACPRCTVHCSLQAPECVTCGYQFGPR